MAKRVKKRTHSDVVRRTQDAQRDYLRILQERTKKSARQIALDADVDPVTLTRLLNKPDYTGTLLPLTMQKLAETFGIQPPATSGFVGRPPPRLPVPIEGQELPPDMVAAMRGERTECEVYRAPAGALEGLGIFGGDYLFVDHAAEPRSGDIVLCQIVNDFGGRPETALRQLVDGILLAQPLPANDWKVRRPVRADGQAARITGVVFAMIRLA